MTCDPAGPPDRRTIQGATIPSGGLEVAPFAGLRTLLVDMPEINVRFKYGR
jgi:hypothetical protein